MWGFVCPNYIYICIVNVYNYDTTVKEHFPFNFPFNFPFK